MAGDHNDLEMRIDAQGLFEYFEAFQFRRVVSE